jgi:hypothetical protein
MVKKNHIKNYETYIKHKATPKCIEHCRFPSPFITESEDILNEYNKLIDGFQVSIMEFWKKILNQQIKELENDIKIHKDILKHHVENINELTVELQKAEEESLINQFNKSNNKCENRIKAKPVKFTIENLKKQNTKQNKNLPRRNSNTPDATNNKPNVKINTQRGQQTNNQRNNNNKNQMTTYKERNQPAKTANPSANSNSNGNTSSYNPYRNQNQTRNNYQHNDKQNPGRTYPNFQRAPSYNTKK